MSIFTSMREFSRLTKALRVSPTGEVIEEKPHWSPEQLDLPPDKRGDPVRVELGLRQNAQVMDFNIRAISMAQRETADAILDAVVPAQIFIEEPAERPGQPPKRVPAGYDYEAPDYLARLRPCQERQSAYVVLMGVDGLHADTPGETDDAKVSALMAAMPSRLVKFLAGEIWNMTYAQGDPADFFTSGGSPPSPVSAPSPRPSPPGRKRK